MCKELAEQVRELRGKNVVSMSVVDMCLVPDVVIPPKFKVPDFEKYKGVSCPDTHLRMYCRKMAAHVKNSKLMIHCFQDSLSGASLDWYMQLEKSNIHSWDDLSNAFFKQYHFNTTLAPNRVQLQNMSQKERESFKEYAQRWREVASRVQPALAERELNDLFMGTLPVQYYERLIGSTFSDFSNLVMVGERIEEGLKTGKISGGNVGPSTVKKVFNGFKRKEAETNAVYGARGRGRGRSPARSAPVQVPYMSYPYVAAMQFPSMPYQQPMQVPMQYSTQVPPNQVQQQQQQQQTRSQNKGLVQQRSPHYHKYTKEEIQPIPMTYSSLLPYLVQDGRVIPRELKTVPGPPKPWFNENARCAFHANSPGHTTEDCFAFKCKVQELIDRKLLTFADVPNIANNPLPRHGTSSVNALIEEGGLVMEVGQLKISLKKVFEELKIAGLLEEGHDDCLVCQGNPEHCVKFKNYLQGLMYQHLIQFSQAPAEMEIDVVVPLINNRRLHISPIQEEELVTAVAPMTVYPPVRIPYENTRAVPWSYEHEVVVGGKPMVLEETTVENITGPSGMTRSGRVYHQDLMKNRGAEKVSDIPPKKVGATDLSTEELKDIS